MSKHPNQMTVRELQGEMKRLGLRSWKGLPEAEMLQIAIAAIPAGQK